MADAEPSLAELISRALESRLAQVRVSMPGIVVSYDAASKTAVVQPALHDVLFDENDDRAANALPKIQNVPVVFPGSSKLTLHFGLEPGDTGDLIFATNSISDWRVSGRAGAPGDLRLHPLGSAKFYPGLRHNANAPPETDESLGVPGGLRLKFGASNIAAGDGLGFVAMAQLVATQLTALKAAISAAPVAPGDGGAAFKAALVSALGAWPASVASSNLKADP